MLKTSPFIPHPLLRGGQAQTIAGHLLSGRIRPAGTRTEQVGLGDGDQLLLHVNEPDGGPLNTTARTAPPPSAPAPLVFLAHGLGGCSESLYILRITDKLNRLGFSVVRFNHRGCGRGGARLARQIYHAGRTEDLQVTFRHLRQRWPGRPLVAVAFSLSGNMLLRYLGDRNLADQSQPDFAMAVCPPIDLEHCSLALSAAGNRLLDRYYTRRLIRTAQEKARLFPETGAAKFPKHMNLRLFDEVYTAPRAGFSSRTAYYEASSAKQHLGAIQIPTTILAAADDPIIPPASFTGMPAAANIHFRLETAGGHMGFLQRQQTSYGDRRWMDAAVVDFVRQCIHASSC